MSSEQKDRPGGRSGRDDVKETAGSLREQIIAAAMDLFRRKGYHATTTQEIIAAAGCSKGGFYHHFRHKEDLLYLAHETFIDYELECALRVVSGPGTAPEKLRAIMIDLVESIAKFQPQVTVFFQERHFLSLEKFALVKQKRDRYEQLVEQVVREGMASGAFRRDLDPRLATLALFGLCNWTYQWYRPSGPLSPREIGEKFAHLFLDGLTATGPARARRGGRTMDSPYLHPEIETMDRATLQQLQLRRLQKQVRRCYAGSEFYRERLHRAGVHPDQIQSLDDLRRIPVVTKQELRDEQAAHPPYGRFVVAPPEQWRELHPSSGTTGNPVLTIWSEQDVRHIADFTARTLWGFGVRPGDTIQNGFSYGLWVAGMAVHHAARQLGCFTIPIGAQLTEKQIFFLQQARSTVLTATPSYGLYIGEKLAELGIDPRELPLRIGAFGGEAGTEQPSTRAKLESALGIDAYDYFGLAEIGPTFAAECTAKAGLHWAEDHHIIEIIDPGTMEPAAPGDIGVLVITHLTREATPMLRYWTGDYARLDPSPCSCGRTHARSPGGILGRHDDLIIYRGAKFYPANVENAVRSLPELTDEYRIELIRNPRTGLDRCVVVAEYQPEAADLSGLTARLQARLKVECNCTPEVQLAPAGTLERTTFKARRVVRREESP